MFLYLSIMTTERVVHINAYGFSIGVLNGPNIVQVCGLNWLIKPHYTKHHLYPYTQTQTAMWWSKICMIMSEFAKAILAVAFQTPCLKMTSVGFSDGLSTYVDLMECRTNPYSHVQGLLDMSTLPWFWLCLKNPRMPG